MPERDSDRIIYETLRDYKADYNSADWEQMEGMLPQKSRKPYYAVAALLLLFLGSVGLWVGTGTVGNGSNEPGNVMAQQELDETSKVSRNNGVAKMEQATDEKGIAGTRTFSEGKQERILSPAISERVAYEKIFGSDENAQASSGRTDHQEERNLVARNFGKGGVETNQTFIGEDHPVVSETAKVSQEETEITIKTAHAQKASDAEGIAQRKVTTGTNESGSDGVTEINKMENFNSGTSTSGVAENIKGLSEPVFALAMIETEMLRTGNAGGTENLSAKNPLSSDALPVQKPQKQIVSFVMGAGAGMNFSFTDPALLTKPGYSVDVAEELMFIKRIGIALTQGYSTRVYDGGAYPASPASWIDYPNSYSSTISSVDFGVDIKANLVNKTKWSWYVKAGVVNTVKLKEVFTYNYTEIDTMILPPQLPPQTNFGGGNNGSTFDTLTMGLNADPDFAPDLTVSGSTRYHIAYHAAAGFDVAINPRVQVQVEAGHSFTQPTVGVEDNRLQSFGVSGKLLVRLSK